MQHRILSAVVVAVSLSFCANISVAAESKAATAAETSDKAKPAKKNSKARANVKEVDINSANKAQLMKLPGIGAEEADKIIAGRPYLTKAHLVTHKVIPSMTYMTIKDHIVARQK